jgi:hypothetical protein
MRHCRYHTQHLRRQTGPLQRRHSLHPHFRNAMSLLHGRQVLRRHYHAHGLLRFLLRLLRQLASYRCGESQQGLERQDWNKVGSKLCIRGIWRFDRNAHWRRGIGPRWLQCLVDFWRLYAVCECGTADCGESELDWVRGNAESIEYIRRVGTSIAIPITQS